MIANVISDRRAHHIGFPRRGFTLVELIVVIGVIVLLVGLTVAIIPAITGQSQTRETANILRLLDVAVQDWEEARDKRLTLGAGANFDIDTSVYPDADDQNEQLVRLVMRRPQSAEVLRQIPGRFLLQDQEDGGWDLLDAWGEAIVMVYPGPTWEQAAFMGINMDDRDADGTVRTKPDDEQNWLPEIRIGIAVNRKLAFVSGGQDTRLGDLHLDVAADSLSDDQLGDVNEAADNVYSAPVLKERP